MPDGGEHIKVGACPYCATRRIRLRRDVRPYRPWRCRVCNKVFRNPKIVTTTSHSKARRRGYVLAKRIPWLERDSRRLRKRLRKQKLKKVLTIAAGAMGVLAVVVIAAQLRSSSEPPSPVELAVSNDRAKVLAPTPEALATVVRLLEVAAAQVDTPAATPNPDPLPLTAHQTVANTPHYGFNRHSHSGCYRVLRASSCSLDHTYYHASGYVDAYTDSSNAQD